ncbi:MAG: hypothetical protein Q9164_006253, partial [Protoblastenia rupestris]
MADSAPQQAQHHYKFDITMTCSGCSGAIERVLKKTEGLNSYTVSLPSQQAEIWTDSVSYETILEKIKKTGKEVRGAEADGVVAE